MYRLLAIVLLTLYSAWATYKVAQAPARCDAKIASLSLEALTEQAEQVQEEQAAVFEQGERVRTEIREVFVPVKEVIREVDVVHSCTGHFDDRLRNALTAAARAANGLPATEHPAGGKSTDAEHR